MNVFTSRLRNRPWEWQVAGLCFILGLLLAASLQTVSYVNRSGIGPNRVGVPPTVSQTTAETIRKKEKEIADLRASQGKLEETLAKGKGQSLALLEQLQKAKLLAGLTAVRGPGVVLVLQDGKGGPSTGHLGEQQNFLIHDWDLRAAVAELLASGAEAISINNQRVIARSALRCTGPTILLNFVPLGSPYEIRAIGDPATITSGLNMRGGLLEGIRAVDPRMVRLEQRNDIELPAYTGSTEVRYAKPVSGEERETSNP